MACKAPAPYTLYVKAKPPGQRNKMDEPVAWMTEDGRVANKDEYELLADHQLDRSIYTIPLYASPRSAPIEGGRVLTPEEAYRCWVDAEYLWPRLIAPKPPWKEFFMQVLQKEASLSPQTMSSGTVDGPVVTHLNMDPNASEETKRAVIDIVHAAYAYKPGGNAMVTVDQAMAAFDAHLPVFFDHSKTTEELNADLRSRLLSMVPTAEQQGDKDAPTPNSEASRSDVVELVEAGNKVCQLFRNTINGMVATSDQQDIRTALDNWHDAEFHVQYPTKPCG